MILHGDCLDVLRGMADNSVDSIVTDPPYGLAFMGKRWDYDVPSVEIWAECLRVLKPGGHLLAFAGTRTQHRMAVRIEDAGFEIRDLIMWCYGSGFPKSHNLSGAWQGWGTALKPALEPITVARKPLSGTVAANVLQWGTGAINVDGCRVGTETTVTVRNGNSGAHGRYGKDDRVFTRENPPGRWPANLIHDGSDEVTGLFPGDDTGSAARFFYCAKASRSDRDGGLAQHLPKPRRARKRWQRDQYPDRARRCTNRHPTVKPTDLMRYLCRLVTPPGGLVLDPFCGSGSTGKAAVQEGFRFIGIEREAEYVEIARARIAGAHGPLFAKAAE